MTDVFLICPFCFKGFYKDRNHFNENKKFGYKNFCSHSCASKSRLNRTTLSCENPNCGKKLERNHSAISRRNYCSHSCAATVSNKENPRHPGIVKICTYCEREFKSREKYCSKKCMNLGAMIPKSQLLDHIKKFVKEKGRVPYKRESEHCHAIRRAFGTWNNGIKAAGFDTNPIMFANKHIAKDGHQCDSFAEKIIDDWLYVRKVEHKRSFPYPGNKRFTCDFIIGDKWVEFFGLSGRLRKYDNLMRRKLNLAKKYNIDLVRIYPRDIFPIRNLKEKLNFL